MRKQFTRLAVWLGVSVVFVVTVNGQDAHKFEVEIPFTFVLASRMLPAGQYLVQRIDPGQPDIVMVKNADAKIVGLVLTHRVESEDPSATSTLVFIRREGKLYLFQIWNRGDRYGNQLPLSNENQPRDQYSVVKLRAKAP